MALIRSPEHYRLHPAGPGLLLDVGCGSCKYPGAVGIDISPATDADVVHDLDLYPWPLETGRFDQVICQDVIEHVSEPYRFMTEIHRVCKPGARVRLRTPHYSSALAYGDASHQHYFSVMTINTFAQPLFAHYTDVAFRVIDVTLDFWDPWRWVGIARLANRFPSTYEMLFAFWFNAMNIRAELEVVAS